MSERWYLAYRDRRGLRKVEVFEADQRDDALHAYAMAESQCVNHGDIWDLKEDVCLFGSDSLATLCMTHASWFAPETIDTEGLLAEAAGLELGDLDKKGKN